jgi:2,4-dienoyl-CoA reductase-like NADH-dependent reductase (Old Yellow Enzyme family)
VRFPLGAYRIPPGIGPLIPSLLEEKFVFAVEVASAVADEIGAGRTGIQISPGNTFNDIAEKDVCTIYGGLSV